MSAATSTDLVYRRSAVRAWTANAAAALPGQVWTYRYSTARAVSGGPFTSWTAGPVRILGAECPVPEYRGMRCLGEVDLDGLRPGWLAARRYSLTRGDQAPVIPFPGRGEVSLLGPDAVTGLLQVRRGRPVLIEHRADHPVSLGLRFVESGRAGAVEDFDDGQGPGRYIGDTWVRLADVTAIVVGVTR
jgi:hypothetical protein